MSAGSCALACAVRAAGGLHRPPPRPPARARDRAVSTPPRARWGGLSPAARGRVAAAPAVSVRPPRPWRPGGCRWIGGGGRGSVHGQAAVRRKVAVAFPVADPRVTVPFPSPPTRGRSAAPACPCVIPHPRLLPASLVSVARSDRPPTPLLLVPLCFRLHRRPCFALPRWVPTAPSPPLSFNFRPRFASLAPLLHCHHHCRHHGPGRRQVG